MSITNLDIQTRDIAFGPHPRHSIYAGKGGKTLREGRSLTFTLSQTGTYFFHDHDDEAVNGVFTVEP